MLDAVRFLATWWQSRKAAQEPAQEPAKAKEGAAEDLVSAVVVKGLIVFHNPIPVSLALEVTKRKMDLVQEAVNEPMAITDPRMAEKSLPASTAIHATMLSPSALASFEEAGEWP